MYKTAANKEWILCGDRYGVRKHTFIGGNILPIIESNVQDRSVQRMDSNRNHTTHMSGFESIFGFLSGYYRFTLVRSRNGTVTESSTLHQPS